MIAVLFYVTDDTWSTNTQLTHGPDENLTPARIGKIRDELGGELARLKRSLAEVWPREAHAACASKYDVSADHVQARQRASDFYDRLQERRAEILDALDRIQNGAYGRCNICGAPIAYARLEIVPETHTCRRCCR